MIHIIELLLKAGSRLLLLLLLLVCVCVDVNMCEYVCMRDGVRVKACDCVNM